VKSLGNFPDPFIAEIAGQPDALRRAAMAAIRQETALSRAATVATTGTLVFAGMGSSYDGCYPAVSDLAAAGVPALMLDAAELLHFRLAILTPEDLLVLVSQSGESAETVAVAQALRSRRQPPTIVSITNGLGNTLSELADVALDTDAGEETGPSTMTFAASLVLLGALARSIAGVIGASIAGSAELAATSVERLVAQEDLPPRLAAWHGGRATTVILGRGAARAAAEMGALTLKEAVGIGVESLQAAQFRHGPLELAGPDLAAIVITTEPETAELDLGLAADLRDLGAAVLVIGATDAALSGVETVAIGALDRLLAPAASIVPVQLLAWTLATAHGRAPGTYVHAAKVTTRE
jgi:glucosamine--fructose-6-phosphate aminotransferase (isomerizing)